MTIIHEYQNRLESIKELSLKNAISISEFLESELEHLTFKRGLKISEKLIKRMPRSIVCLISCLTLDRPYLCDEVINLAIENHVPIIFTHSREYTSKILKDKVYTVSTVVQSLKEYEQFKEYIC